MNSKQYLFLALAAITLVLSSCKEEIELTGNFKETAVVYGLLNQSDSVQYIKITRAFIGPGNALEISQIPDSNYFSSVNATVKEYIGGVLNRSWTLTDTVVNNKSVDGVFYGPEQKLYCFYTPSSAPLNAEATYKLDIDINNGLFTVSSETQLVNNLSAGTISNQTATMKFSDKINSYKTQTFSVNTGNAGILNTTLKINYYEIVGTDSTLQSVLWDLGESKVNPNEIKSFSADGTIFYNRIKSACDASTVQGITKRVMQSIDVIVTGGTEDLYKYIEVNQPSSSLSQSKPTFTNLTATNGYNVIGIFSSRQTYTVNKPFKSSVSQYVRCIDKNSTAELCEGPITGLYLFCSDHEVDINFGESFACN